MRCLALIGATALLLYSDTRCLPCHPSQTKSWSTTGMGRSITECSPDTDPSGEVNHRPSGTAFRVASRSGTVVHESSRKGRRAAYVPLWAVGSGNQGRSFLHRIEDALFQSPVSWYTERAAYDMSPGFETDATPDFFRPVTSDCLFCHAGAARPRPGTQNRYLDPPFERLAIGCDRCHGDPAAHVANPVRRTIVNPARLEPERRDAVCEQCHLGGEARIPNPGRQFADFRPGLRMEEAFSVYVRNVPEDPGSLKVVSHSEQMVLSRCFLRSRPRMWCGTCHDPHSEPADKVVWYRQKCIACHSGQSTVAHEAKSGSDCAGCHMRRLKPYDGGHTAFTDHWIRTRTERRSGADSNALRPWREPATELRKRNLGLAYISAGAKSGDTSRMLTGYGLLGSRPADGAVETARGMMLLRLGKPSEAGEAFRRAVAEQPGDSVRRYNLAVALHASGDRNGAMRNIEQAIALEPLLEDAYVLAAEIEPQRAAEWKRRYLKLVPQRVLP